MQVRNLIQLLFILIPLVGMWLIAAFWFQKEDNAEDIADFLG